MKRWRRKSILKIKEEINEDVEVYLIATDTITSRLAAELIQHWFNENDKGISVHFDPLKDVIKGLQVKDRKRFEKDGLSNLINKIDKFLENNHVENFILNITGGYKALIPYTTLISQIKQIPSYYTFQDTTNEDFDLLKIPYNPIDIKWDLFEKNSHLLAILYKGTDSWSDVRGKYHYSDDLNALIWIDEIENLAELSPIGKLYYNRYKNYIIISIRKGCELFSEKKGNLKEIEKAILELNKRLNELIQNNPNIKNRKDLLERIDALGDKNDLRHGENPKQNIFIFKSTNINQIRVVYEPSYENGILNLIIYDYLRNNFDHSGYIKEFKQKYTALSSFDFYDVPIYNK